MPAHLLASSLMSPHALTLTNVRIWDGVSDDYLEADAISIADGRIKAVGEVSKPCRHTRDMSGLTLLPGLMDAHVHMCLDPNVPFPGPVVEVAPPHQTRLETRVGRIGARHG